MTSQNLGSTESCFWLLFPSSGLLEPALSWICSTLLHCKGHTWGRRTQACLLDANRLLICRAHPIQSPKSFRRQVLQVTLCFLMQAFLKLLLNCLLRLFHLHHFLLFIHSHFHWFLKLFNLEFLQYLWVWFMNLRQMAVIFHLLKSQSSPLVFYHLPAVVFYLSKKALCLDWVFTFYPLPHLQSQCTYWYLSWHLSYLFSFFLYLMPISPFIMQVRQGLSCVSFISPW